MGTTKKDNTIREYKIEFTALEETVYSVLVKANTAEEALKLFGDTDYDRGEYNEEEFCGTVDEMNIAVVGYYETKQLSCISKYHPFDEKDVVHSEKEDIPEILIGHVGVDSGQLLVCDPSYIDSEWELEEDFDPVNPKHNFSYNACVKETLSDKGYGQLNYKLGHAGVGVAFQSGYGDGIYPVYAKRNNDGRIIEITIKMD